MGPGLERGFPGDYALPFSEAAPPAEVPLGPSVSQPDPGTTDSWLLSLSCAACQLPHVAAGHPCASPGRLLCTPSSEQPGHELQGTGRKWQGNPGPHFTADLEGQPHPKKRVVLARVTWFRPEQISGDDGEGQSQPYEVAIGKPCRPKKGASAKNTPSWAWHPTILTQPAQYPCFPH
jgi:hypothetical protein